MKPKTLRLMALGAAAMMLAGGCGSQLGEAELLSANQPFGAGGSTVAAETAETAAPGASQPQPATHTAETVVDSEGARTLPSAGSGSTVSEPRTATPAGPAAARPAGTSTATAPTAKGGAPTPGSPASASAAPNASSPSPGGAAAPAPGTPATQAPASAGTKSEIVLGSFGVASGVLGVVSGPAPPAIRAWSAAVNAAGGVNGHPVRVILADDNADPARSLAIVRRLVEQDKVLAFLNDYSFTLPAVLPYLEQHKIPIIGSIGGDASGDHSPMMFNPMTGPDVGQAWGFILNALTQAPGKKKVGILYCREASICAIIKDGFKKLLPYEGLEVVYEAFVSLAQPDYTGEMLQAKQAGAEIILPLVDTASVHRLVSSGRRQNYDPAYVGTYNLNQDAVYAFPDTLEGVFLTSRVGAWDTSPLLGFYREAMDRYQPKGPRGDLGAGVFVVGKLFAEKIGPFIAEPPTTSQILDGLYSLKNEKLGGLLPGIGFARDSGHVDTNQCIVPVRFTGGKFRAHDAESSFVCAPGWKPFGG
jgi:branched-chain amino acid transport system substrate-binding protein